MIFHQHVMTDSIVHHDSFVSVQWIAHCSCMCHESSVFFPWLIHMSPSYMPWIIHVCVFHYAFMCALTHSYEYHHSFMFVFHDAFLCARTHWHVYHNSFICAPCLIDRRSMIHSYVCRDSFVYVPHTHTDIPPRHRFTTTETQFSHDQKIGGQMEGENTKQSRRMRATDPTVGNTALLHYMCIYIHVCIYMHSSFALYIYMYIYVYIYLHSYFALCVYSWYIYIWNAAFRLKVSRGERLGGKIPNSEGWKEPHSTVGNTALFVS